MLFKYNPLGIRKFDLHEPIDALAFDKAAFLGLFLFTSTSNLMSRDTVHLMEWTTCYCQLSIAL
jgi:hypothetical protein